MTAGADARVSFALTGPDGPGGSATAGTTATVSAPDGVTLRSLTLRPAAREADTASTARTLDVDVPVTCDDASRCVVTVPAIPPGDRLIVEADVMVAARTPDEVALTVAVDGRTVEVPLTVTSGFAGVTLDGPAAVAAGTTTVYGVTATPVSGVTDPGPLTIVSDREDVTFPVTPDGCAASGERRLMCTTRVPDLAVAVAAGHPGGPLPVRFTDAAGRTVPLGCGTPVILPPAEPAQRDPARG